MRFPLALTAKITRHIIKHKLRRTPRFALVLQLEPLHTCNLTCTGCGRIREYSTSLKDMMSLEDCLASALDVDGHTISPGYDFDAAKTDIARRLGKKPEDIFLTRAMTRRKFAQIQQWSKRFNIFGTPVYQEFLAGKRELTCTAWAIPPRNIRGWKAPCYLTTDRHYAHYQEMLDQAVWAKYGVVDGIARDPRCENCMVHCGYDPGGALGTNYQPDDNWKNFKYNLQSRPKRLPFSAELEKRAFNGAFIGNGHHSQSEAALPAAPPV